MTTPEDGPALSRIEVRVRQIRLEGAGIHSYELTHIAGGSLPPFEAGAHIDVHLPDGLTRQYSLSNDPAERHRYVIAVLLEKDGRGGSRAVHERVRVGDTLSISLPRNQFRLAKDVQRALLLAGGIGITPLKSMVHALEAAACDYVLYYCARDAHAIAFRDDLAPLAARGRVRFHYDGGEAARNLDIAALLAAAAADTHLYYCGPPGFMRACARAAESWPRAQVHCEHFVVPTEVVPTAAPVVGEFTVTLARSQKSVIVRADQSIVAALATIGVAVETSCESGLCATCKTRYLSGEVEHRDYVLEAAEQAQFMTPCVSRARQGPLVLDL